VKISWMILAMLFATGTATAQMYKWVDKDGKVRYGDTPPPGSKVTSIKAPRTGESAPAPAVAGAAKDKDAKKGPLTPAEQEQEYRKRRQEEEKAGKKAEQERQAATAKNEGCERSKEYLSTLQSGQRIARTNPSGERYYMDENQVAQEIAKAQQSIQQACK
jgi:hypothetical protein